jgi:SAM-dependent methyltransferase
MQCGNCGCGFVNLEGVSFKPEVFYQTYYNENDESKDGGYEDYFFLEKALRLSFRKKIKAINRYFANKSLKKRLLDIGCGPGFFLDEASKHFDVYGIDISKVAVDYAVNKLNLKVVNTKFRNGLFKPNEFDVVTLWDTLEHMEDPQQALREISILVKRNGVLAITTGDFLSWTAWFWGKKWHLLTVPQHLFFFTKKSINILVEKNGFKILDFSYPYGFYTISYMIKKILASFDKRYYYSLLPYKLEKFLSKVIIPFNLFDIMFIIARRI